LHELLHFIHPNHSSEFYKLNEKLMPDYKKHEEQLNKELINQMTLYSSVAEKILLDYCKNDKMLE